MKLAERMNRIRASEIRELLKLADQPGILSFAGGLPAPELFPAETVARIYSDAIRENGASLLQYGTTEGYAPLRAQIAVRMNVLTGTRLAPDDILVTSGSQQGLDLLAKMLLDPGAAVLCESPTYLAAINAFHAYEPRFVPVETDDEGMIPESLDRAVRENPDIRMVYVIPDFQNPTGRTWTETRRRALIEILAGTDIPIVEDNPYGELRYEGVAPPSLLSLDRNGQVFALGTFSKILCPGLRVGWTAGPREGIRKLALIKQSADLHTSTVNQAVVSRFLAEEDLDGHISRLRAVYRSRRDAMTGILSGALPATCRISRPEGGLFLWIELPEDLNARTLLEECLADQVAFVPGGAFFPCGGHENTLRMNFSFLPEEKIAEGMKRFLHVLERRLAEVPADGAPPDFRSSKAPRAVGA